MPDPGAAAAGVATAPAQRAAANHAAVPSSDEGTIYDLGYAPHEGPRLGRGAAIRAMIFDGSRRALGLRRKAWAKVLPWGLIAAAVVPAAWVVALTFVVSGFDLDDAGPFGDPAEFFEMIGMLAMFFVALVAPTLLIPDREHGVLSIYASRPVRAIDYLFARGATLVVLTTLFMLIPHLIVYIGISSLYVDGFRAGLVENGKEIPAILGSIAAYVLGYGAPAFLVALFVRRAVIATGVYVFAMFMTVSLIEAMPRATELLVFKVLALFGLFWHPYSVRDWLFDREPEQWALERVGFDSWLGAVIIVAVAVTTAVIAHRRYRREF
jgi:ABC-2 type transport system permease protein